MRAAGVASIGALAIAAYAARRPLSRVAARVFAHQRRSVATSAGADLPDACTVDGAWLAPRLASVRLLDASWFMPNSGRKALDEFRACRIPGASFFDIDGVCDVTSKLPHMLPDARGFAAAMDALNIDAKSTVIVYDGSGIYSSPRVWWTLRAFGHPGRVAVLDGGLPAWKAAGRPLDTAPASEDAATGATRACRAAYADPSLRPRYTPGRDPNPAVRTLDDAIALSRGKSREQFVDARTRGRFEGSEPEPRAGMRGGHIPGSHSVPFSTVISPAGTLRSRAELESAFAAVDRTKPVVATCGTGLTACMLVLGLHAIGIPDAAVFDGSWVEWATARDGSLPDGLS